MSLSRIGWNTPLESAFERFEMSGVAPARVTREDRGRTILLAEAGEVLAEVSGRFRRHAGPGGFPVVGDWVAYKPRPPDGRGVIHAVLPRRNAFSRKVAGARSKAQALAANVDVAFLVNGLDADFSLRRIERYLTLAHECETSPVIVLNKDDLCDDIELRVRQVEGLATEVPVLATGAEAGSGIDALRAHLGPGRTGVFLGSSGVGKSTLVNRLLGVDVVPTQRVRAHDSRGRHTTTRRELRTLPGDAGVVIDTPGLREIQLRGDADRALGSFAEVQEAAAACRFRDCRHQGEPGCAVQAALLDGRIDSDRYESFLEQRRELAYQARRTDEHARRAERDRWRKITIDHRKRRRSGHHRKP